MNHDTRHGSARYSDSHDIHAAGLTEPGGIHFGFDGNKSLSLDSQGPILTLAGSRSGKLATVLAFNLIMPRTMRGHPLRALVYDPKGGELAAISYWSQIDLNRPAYAINSHGVAGVPSQNLNPLDILKPGSPTLMGDCQAVFMDLLPPSSDKDGYFKEVMRGWAEQISYWHVNQFGGINLPQLYDIANVLKANSDRSDELLAAMMDTGDADTVAVAEEMDFKRRQTPKEYSPTISTLVNALSSLKDPARRATFEGKPDFSLSILTDPLQSPIIYYCDQEDYAERAAPISRLIFSVAKLYKARAPESPPMYVLVDEANILKTFPTLLQLHSFGPGINARIQSVYQDTGQTDRHFSPAGTRSLIASSQLRQLFGVRDYDTAKLVSDMAGYQTVDADDALRREAARYEKRKRFMAALQSDTPMMELMDARYQDFAEQHRQKERKLLIEPDEVMNMPSDKQICFVSDLELDTLYVDRWQYWTRRETAGRYYPNPYQPNPDRVMIKTRFGNRPAAVTTERVPDHLAHWPQHKNGYWKRIEGFPYRGHST